jgi:hypothetical protein
MQFFTLLMNNHFNPKTSLGLFSTTSFFGFFLMSKLRQRWGTNEARIMTEDNKLYFLGPVHFFIGQVHIQL